DTRAARGPHRTRPDRLRDPGQRAAGRIHGRHYALVRLGAPGGPGETAQDRRGRTSRTPPGLRPPAAGPLRRPRGGCTFPGCDAPARGCQFHHVRAWSDGGPTPVANGGLGCPVHHGFVGDTPASWKTVINPGAPGRCLWIPPGVDRLTDA